MFRLALKNVVRSHKNPILMAFAIMLSLGLLLGTGYAIDVIATSYVKSKLNQVPVDYVYGINTELLNHFPNFTKLRTDILSVNHVKDVKIVWMRSLTCFYAKTRLPISSSERLNLINNGTAKNVTIDFFGINFSFFNSTEGIIWIKGNKTLRANGVVIPQQFAKAENLDVGDTLVLMQLKKSLSKTIYINVTITGIYRFTGNFRTLFIEKENHATIFLTSIDTLNETLNHHLSTHGFKYSKYYSGIGFEFVGNPYIAGTFDLFIYVFFKRNEIINTWNIKQSQSTTMSVSSSIYSKIVSMLGVNTKHLVAQISVSPLYGLLQDTYYWIFGSRIFYGILYVFIIILMIEFIKAMSYMYKTKRLKEIGLLLLKGASQGQLNKLFTYESIIVGFIGVIGSIFISYIVYWYFVSDVASIFGTNVVTFYFSLPSFSDWVVIFLLVGIFVYIMRDILLRDLSIVTPVEVLQTAEERKPQIKTRKDKVIFYLYIFGLTASGLKLTALMLGVDTTKLWSTYNTGYFFILWFVIWIITMIDSFLFVFGNITFIYCAIKIVSLKIDKLSKYLRRIIRRIMGELSLITTPQISKTVARYARVGIVIGLVVSLGTSISIARATILSYNVRTAKVEVGADIKITTYTSSIATFENITAMKEIYNSTYIVSSTPKQYIFAYTNTYVVAIDPERYMSVAKDYLEDDFSEHGMFRALSMMKQNKSYVLINKRVATDAGIHVGDSKYLWILVNNTPTRIKCIVLDIINALPGIPDISSKHFSEKQYMGSYYVQNPFMVINQNLINKTLLIKSIAGSEATILVDIKEGYNQTRIAEKIAQKYPVMNMVTAREKIKAANIDPSTLTDVEYLWIEYQVMVLIATIAVMISMISIIESRKREFGMLITRGATTHQLIKLMLSEFLAILFIVIPIGVITGIPASYSVLPQLLFMHERTAIPIKLVISQDLFIVAVLSVLSIIGGVLAATYAIEKEKVVDVIQFE